MHFAKQKNRLQPQSKKQSTLDMAKLFGTLVAVGGFVVHLIGSSAHEQFIREWGLEPAMFPRSTESTFLLGYEAATTNVLTAILNAVSGHLYMLIASTAFVLLYMWTFKELSASKLGRWFRSRTNSLTTKDVFILKLAVVVQISIFSLMAVLTICTLFLAPVSIGRRYGLEMVTERTASAKDGCRIDRYVRGCVVVDDENGEQINGLLIAASDRYLAVYVDGKHVQVIDREKSQLSTLITPSK